MIYLQGCTHVIITHAQVVSFGSHRRPVGHLEPLIPAAKHGGRPREVDMREIVNAMFYINRSGCQWDMLPHDLPPKSSVYVYFAQWRRRRHLANVGRGVADESADGSRGA